MSNSLRKEIVMQFVNDSKEIIIRCGDVIEVTSDLSRENTIGKVESIGEEKFTVDCSKEYRADVQQFYMNQVRNIKVIKAANKI